MGDAEADLDSGDGARGPSATPLAYRPDPVGGRVSVRGFRLLLVLTLLNTTLLGASVLGPQLFPFLQIRWTQWQASRAQEKARLAAQAIERQCLAHSMPPEKVMYEEEPDRVAKLLKDDPMGYRAARPTSNAPPGWVAPVSAAPPGYYNGNSGSLLFLHERTTPGGVHYVVSAHLLTQHQFIPVREPSGRTAAVKLKTRRHVLVQARLATTLGAPPAGAQPNHQQNVELILPDTEAREIVRFAGDVPIGQTPALDYGNMVRFFGGQVDPNDSGHFTVRYQLDGRDGVIDGWMKDDGVDMRPREGYWSFDAGGQAWRLPTGPDTRPTTLPGRPGGSAPATAPSAPPRTP